VGVGAGRPDALEACRETELAPSDAHSLDECIHRIAVFAWPLFNSGSAPALDTRCIWCRRTADAARPCGALRLPPKPRQDDSNTAAPVIRTRRKRGP